MIAKPSFADPGPSALQTGYFSSKNRLSTLFGWLAIVTAALFQCAAANPLQFGDFTYTEQAEGVTITDYPENAVGPVVIPDEIAGKPVTAIGPSAFQFCATITGVTVPATVTSIGTQAFFGCSALVSINIPAGMTVIGDSAFESCIALASMTIPDSMTAIGNSVFLSCEAMTSISLPATITSLGNNAFFNCKSLPEISIPNSVTSIGANAFSFCLALTSIEIPAGVTSIPFGCFSDCAGLTSITLPAGITSIGGSAFANCSSLPALSIPSGVTSIGTFAFKGCSALASMVIPNGVTAIGSNTFELCTSLVSVTLPTSLATIGNTAFKNCTALTSITLPAGTLSIGSSTFELCTSLTSVTLPSTITSIGGSAFLSCRALPSIAIPANVSSIGFDAFGHCAALTSITVDSANLNFSSLGGVLFNKTQSALIAYPRGFAGLEGHYSIPNNVTTIRSAAFRNANAVTSIHIPASVTAIENEAFAGCASLTSFSVAPESTSFNTVNGLLTTKSKLTLFAVPGGISGAFTVPTGITHIRALSFRYSPLLTEIIFPSSVVSVGNNAASDCPLLAKVTFQGNAPGTVGTNPFAFAATGFKVFYYSTSTGFTNPWQGYATEAIVISDPFGSWLGTYDLPPNTPLSLDSNGDGVSLLMAYALNLDPRENLSGEVPQTVFSPTQMSLSYHSGAQGVTYRVEVSPDLNSWSNVGVTVTGPDANGISTATANRTGESRFMRLSVAY